MTNAPIQTQDYFRELVTMLFIRKRIIVVVTCLMTLCAILIAFLWPPVYAARGEILVKQNRPLTTQTSVENVQTELTQLKEEDISSEMQIIKSRSVAVQTVKALYADDKFAGSKALTDRLKLTNRIVGSLQTSLIPKSNVIRVSLTWADPSEAQYVLQTYFEQYFIYRSEIFNPKEAADFFERQYRQYSQELMELENALIDLSQRENISNASAQISSNLMLQQDLEQRLASMNSRLAELAEHIQFLQEAQKKQDLEFFTSLNSLPLGKVAEALMNLNNERQRVLSIYTETSEPGLSINRQVQDVREQLNREVASYIASQRAEMAGIQSSIERAQKDLARIEQRNVQLHATQVKVNRIKRRIKMLEDSSAIFAKRLEEQRINTSAKTDTMFSVSEVSPPHALPSPVFPNQRKVIALGLILGFVLSCMIGFVVEFFDHTFKRPEDVTTYTGLQPIFSIRCL